MKTKWIRILSLAVVASIVTACTGCQQGNNTADSLSSWTQDSSAKQSLEEYLDKVTTEGNAEFIPQEDRIAAFDLDGTLLCEKPNYIRPTIAMYRIDHDLAGNAEAQAAKQAYLNSGPTDFQKEETMDGIAFAGMTPDECAGYVSDFMQNQKEEGFENLAYKDAFYKPMMEVIDLLQKKNFTIYLLSGTDQAILWSIEDNVLHMPRSQAIGSNFEFKGKNQGNQSSTDYVLSPDEDVVRGSQFLYDNIDLAKVTNFYRIVGKQPVMMFGNSSGDFSALNSAISNPQYAGYAMIIDHNDGTREYDYGNTDEIRGAAEKYGWQYVSMKDDFKTVFMKDAVKKAAS